MRRDLSTLGRSPIDLLVIGGGIYGAWTAYDAALRGLQVALVERTDWAAGTSSASSKLIHGGLRYLEHLHLGLVRLSLSERRLLSQLAPHRIQPLRFLIPVYRSARVGRLTWKAGLTLYDLLAGPNQPVAPHQTLSRDVVAHGFPFLEGDGLRGGFSYGDCLVDDARFTLELVDGAIDAGVAAGNRAEVSQLLRDGPRVAGASVTSLDTGATVEVRAAATVDCSGPWGAESSGSATRLTKGVHVVLPRLPTHHAILLLAPSDGRVIFLIPWYGRTLLGTTETPYRGDPSEVRVEREDVCYLLNAANAYLTRPWQPSDVLGGFAGLRVLPDQPDANPSDITREYSLEQATPGLFVPVGGKFTTARVDAAKTVDAVMQWLGRSPGARPTAERPFPWVPTGDFGAWQEGAVTRGTALGLDEEVARMTSLRFGSHVDAVLARIQQRPDLANRLHPALPFSRAEVVHAVEDEMARSLDDILRRRVPVSILAPYDVNVARDAAELAATALGWTDEQRQWQESQFARARLRTDDWNS